MIDVLEKVAAADFYMATNFFLEVYGHGMN